MSDATIKTDAGMIHGFPGKPSGSDPAPGVLILHEALGLTDGIRAYCQRFAEEGYLALAPDLFSHGRKFRCLVQSFRALNRREGQLFRSRPPDKASPSIPVARAVWA